jgi:DNA polymerase III epsilon subunit-like protein
MNFNPIVFLDFETCSKNPNKTQPIQLAAVCIHSRRLELIKNNEFQSYIKPIFDDKAAIEAGVDPIEEEALKVNKITREQLIDAPNLDVVWKQFVDWVNSFNYKKTVWTSPILAGFNNNGFDDKIIHRLCERYGPFNKEREQQALFHPIHNIDLMKVMWLWTENNDDIKSLSMDSIRTWLGMSKENAHNAIQDVKDGATLLTQVLSLTRHFGTKTRFTEGLKSGQ